jgi:lysozyme family protein
MDPLFLNCLPFTLKQECNVYTGTEADWTNPRNYDDDPQDPGGATQCGITHIDFDEYREARGLPVRDVRQMGGDVGRAIYNGNYWLPFCPKLPPGLNLFFFDTNVNMGTHRAVMLLQASVGATVDGAWGQETDKAVAAITDAAAVIRDEEGRRAAVYRSFRTFPRFGGDWLRRDSTIGGQSIAMVPA